MNCENNKYHKYKLNLFNQILDKLVIIDNKDIFSGDILLTAFKTSFNHYYKFKVFNDMILNNLFVSDDKKEEFITIFSNVQKKFFNFKKIYYVYCFNKTQINESIKYDLHFNHLSIYKNKNKITLIESNTINTFVVSDLLKLICISLINSDNIFSFPLAPKNPYTNIELSYHNLYNLYIYCKENNFIIPQAFLYYFYSDFNLEKLKSSYEPYFREKAIKSFYDNLSFDSKEEYIKDILKKYKNIIPLKINRHFPFSTVVDKLQHVILYHLKSIYSLQPAIVIQNKSKLETILYDFYKENKFFGTIVENSNNFRIQSTNDPFIFGLPRPLWNPISQNSSEINNNIITEVNNMPVNNNFEELIQIATQEYNNSINNTNNNSGISNNVPYTSITDNMFNIINQLNDSSNNNITTYEISNNFINNQIDRLRNEENQLIINNQTRLREMLAGDDYDYSDIDSDNDNDGYTD